jgi:predicted HAD superfamily Cof-like phosphohydrolase
MTNFSKVKKFMKTGGQVVNDMPVLIDDHNARLRVSLLDEEMDELALAVFDRDIVEIADALTDILYVVYGTGHAYGIDLDACFAEVHRSNMSKFENGLPLKREDGKILKGKHYSPPDLGKVLLVQEIKQLCKEYEYEIENNRQ